MDRKPVSAARREVFWTVAGFALVQVVLAFCIDRSLFQVRDHEFAAKMERLRARQAEAPHRPLALVLGSSRTQMGLDASGLNEAGGPWLTFNFGLQGCGPIMYRVALRRLREEGVRPDLLVVEVVPVQLLAGNGCPIENRWLDGARFRADEVVLASSYQSASWRVPGRWLLGRALPCVHDRGELRDWLALDRTPDGDPLSDWTRVMDPWGWNGYNADVGPEKAAEMRVRTANEFRAEFHGQGFAAGEVQALRDLFDDCRRDGIPVVLLLMPEAPSFRALYPEGLDRQLLELMESLRRDCGLRAVVDARSWIAEDGFLDGHHLIKSGARLFTERFAREVLHPAMASENSEGLPVSKPTGSQEDAPTAYDGGR